MRTSGEGPRSGRASGLLPKLISMAVGVIAILAFVLVAHERGGGPVGAGAGGVADLFGQSAEPVPSAGAPSSGAARNNAALAGSAGASARPAPRPAAVGAGAVGLTKDAGNFNFVAPTSASLLLTPLARPAAAVPSGGAPAGTPTWLASSSPLAPYLPPGTSSPPTGSSQPPSSAPPSPVPPTTETSLPSPVPPPTETSLPPTLLGPTPTVPGPLPSLGTVGLSSVISLG